MYGRSVYPPAPPFDREETGINKVIKGISGILGILILLGGLVWAAATLSTSMVSDEELEEVEDRLELVEKNDLVQTVVLEQIKSTLHKIEKKLDRVLSNSKE